jgi:hypothetical protein
MMGGAPGEEWTVDDRVSASSDRLLDVETQLAWLRELGFEDVDCYWKWLEMALLGGIRRS